MDDTQNAKIAAERAAYIDRLANAIIDDAQKRDMERRRNNEKEMKKLTRWLEEKTASPLTGSQPERGTP